MNYELVRALTDLVEDLERAGEFDGLTPDLEAELHSMHERMLRLLHVVVQRALPGMSPADALPVPPVQDLRDLPIGGRQGS